MARAVLVLWLVGAAVAGCGGGDEEQGKARTLADDAGSQAVRLPAPREASVSRGARFALRPVGRFDEPLDLVQPPDDPRRLFVVEKGGRVRIVRGGRVLRRPFLSLRGRVSTGAEQGLLGMAFAPSYRRSRRLYVAYTDRRGHLRIEEWRRSRRTPDRADRGSRRLVLRIRQPRPTHNGGHLSFGPDGLLYIGVGDGGGPRDPRRTGQDRSDLLGSLLRIDPRRTGRRPYRTPATNPFAGARRGRGEVYAYGLRNPWRFTFDRATGDIAIGDVGQEAYEELDFRRRGRAKGANFGWSVWEGDHRLRPDSRAPGHVRPIHTYGRDRGCSIIAGPVVRDPELRRLRGRLLYGDFCNGQIRSIVPRVPRGRDPRSERVRVRGLSAFAEDRRGRIYAISLLGPVYRLVPR